MREWAGFLGWQDVGWERGQLGLTSRFMVRASEERVAVNFKAKGEPGLECGVWHVKFGRPIKLPSGLRCGWDP